tara:strand:+ start:129 stop:617 length:489 start_codon:yes stop_codon:yes gene_type:complete
MKQRGFTLIELLVVVAIIGILAAVGVVAYNGYTSSAQQNAVKKQHKMLIKSVNAELMKCDLGEKKIMADQVWCSWANKTQMICNHIVEYNRNGPKLKNPYDPDQSSHIECSASVPNSDKMIGKLIYDTSSGQGGMKVTICLKTPCNNASNRFTETFTINNQF